MALLPTEDKTLRLRLFQMLEEAEHRFNPYLAVRQTDTLRDTLVTEILQDFERRGYYKGLPSSVEEALNSGDGVYRP